MNTTAWVGLLAILLIPPAGADEKDKKKAEKPAAAVPADDLVKQADAKLAAGDAAGAAELLRKAAALPGAGGDVSLRLGRALEGAQDWDGAIDAYTAAAATLSGPAKGEALARLALAQEVRGVPAFAESAAGAAAADAEGVWPVIAQARVRAREGKGDEAVALAQKAVGAGGGAAAQAALGAAQEARKDYPAAEAAYRAALATEATLSSATIGLARVLRLTQRAPEAEAMLQKVIAASPGAVEAYKESARAKMAQKRAADAFTDAVTAATLAEHDADAQKLVVQVTVAKALDYVAQNQAELAIQDLTALRDKNPALAEPRVGLAKALAARRQTDAALVELGEAVKLEPGNAEAHYQTGILLHNNKGNAAGAVTALAKATEAEPTNLEYRTALGAALVGAKEYDRAVKELTTVATTPGYARADAHVHLGAAHLGAKRYKDAVAPLDKALAITPNDAQAEAYLAWAYFGLKDAAKFKLHGGKARTLGHKEPTLLTYLTRIEAGEAIK
jgi:tetratricopeptide (TPR) repeat protein